MSRLIRTPLRSYTATAVSDASGDATFTLPASYFSSLVSVFATVSRAATSPTDYPTCHVRSQSTSTIIVRVGESKTTNTLLISTTEGLETSGAGITVNLFVIGT